jgi:two-component system NtrC family response regulator
MHTVLIVDDEAKLREVLAMALEGMGHTALTAASGPEAIALLEENREVHLVLCDLRMPKMSGQELLEAVKTLRPELPVIIMTAFAALKDAVTLIKEGAFDYLPKPFDLDALEATVTSALRHYALSSDNAELRRIVRKTRPSGKMVGQSPALLAILRSIREVSESSANVLIIGESGTGKELVARGIHDSSGRKDAPFVTINCAAIHESLLESELFGHVKGAFTGATSDRSGRFVQAHGGTLFLDEIGDMPLALQAKILRVLQDKVVEPVGGQTGRKVDVRILAATNQNLGDAIAGGRFREDLFFRLNVYPLVVPPLRERTEDIPLLIVHFAEHFARQLGKRPIIPAPELFSFLQAYAWPGNIRELQNVVERLTITHAGRKVRPEEIAGWLTPMDAAPEEGPPAKDAEIPRGLREHLETVERDLILSALKRAGGVQARAAKILNISERSIWHRIKKLGIAVPR